MRSCNSYQDIKTPEEDNWNRRRKRNGKGVNMFEKEAEEYSNNWKINKNNDLNFAELVELRAVIYKANKDGAEFGYNKANEWHYVKDGDLPKNGEKNILLYCKEHFYTTSYVTVGYFEEDVFYNDCDMEEDVIAWKEIVLPNIKE